MIRALQFLVVAIYNLIILGSIAYLVQIYNWSPWTFLLAVIFCASYKDDKK